MIRKLFFLLAAIAVFTSSRLSAQVTLVSPDLMNVVYIGVDNPVSVASKDVDPGDLMVSVAGCGATLSGGKGKYTIRVASAGTVNVEVSQKKSSGNISLGTYTLRAKRVPDPVTYVGFIKGDGILSSAEVKNIAGVVAKLENFDFTCSFSVMSYKVTTVSGTKTNTYSLTGAGIDATTRTALASLRAGDMVIFSEVNVKGPDGATRKIPGVVINVR